MRKVHKLMDAENERESKREQGIHAANHQPIEQLLCEHAVLGPLLGKY